MLTHRILALRSFVILSLALIHFSVKAQCPSAPPGDQVTYGDDQWIGYVYSNGPEGISSALAPEPGNTNYIGYLERDENFDNNYAGGSISGANICGAPADNFSVRYKMKKNLAPGYYEFTVGGDDGYRLSIDGGNTFITNPGRWSGHGFVNETILQYLNGGETNFVLEYFEAGGDARIQFNYQYISCTALPVSSVTNNIIYSCNTSTVVHFDGNLEPYTYYEYGSGSIVGQNHMGGTGSAFVTINNVGTYWVRKNFQSPCSGSTEGYVFEVTAGIDPPGDYSADYGINVWNVYGFEGTNNDLAFNTYKGYYVDSNLSFNSENHFGQWGMNPSQSPTWRGCAISGGDNFSYIAKREGFDCGEYQLSAVAWDDAIWVYLDIDGDGPEAEQLLYHYNSYSGPVTTPIDLGTYFLDEHSRMRVKSREDAGGANINVQITPLTHAPDSVTGNDHICIGEQITLTANGGVLGTTGIYEWGSGTVDEENVIPSENGAQLTVTPSQDITYWVRITFPGYCSTEAAQINITVDNTVAGTLATPAATICKYDGIRDITVQDYNGTIMYWEMADDALFTSNVTSLAVTEDVLTTADTGIFTASKYFRAIVKDGICDEEATPAFLITVTPSVVYNGSWSGTPDVTTTLEVESSLNIAADITVCSCYVTNNATVTIPSGRDMKVKGKVSVSEGSNIVVENNASLTQIDAGAVNEGTIEVQRNSSQLFKLDYTLWSAPVAGQNLYSFSPATLQPRFYIYGFNNGDDEYISVTAPLNNNSLNFQPARGYLIRMPNTLPADDPNYTAYNAGTYSYSFEGLFTGTPHNGDIQVQLSALGQRYNAVGNPYPSPVNVHEFFDTNENVLDAGSALYFWRKKNNANATSYATLTKDTYVFNDGGSAEDEDYSYGGSQWDELFNGAGVDPSQWVINVGQGFFVRTAENVTNPELLFTNSMRRGNVHNGQFFRNDNTVSARSRLWLNLKGSETGFSQTALVYSSTATTGIDYGRDGAVLSGGSVSLYSIAEDKDLAIQARPAFNDQDIVQLGYRANVTGAYTIDLHRKDGIFAEGQTIYVKDNSTGLVHDLGSSGYTFTTEAGVFENRLEIIYSIAALGTGFTLNDQPCILSRTGDQLMIKAGKEIASVSIHDLTGKKIYEDNDIYNDTYLTTNIFIQQQLLIVKIHFGDGEIAIEKIIMQ